jgi:hypothetical protein
MTRYIATRKLVDNSNIHTLTWKYYNHNPYIFLTTIKSMTLATKIIIKPLFLFRNKYSASEIKLFKGSNTLH